MIFKKKKFNKNLIFVIGAGRSGTHLLGRTIGNINEIEAYIEDKRFFKKVTELAINQNRTKSSTRKILNLYKNEFAKSDKDYILEKTHPNIWLVEDIMEFFDRSKFIGIKRNVYATVASMLNHQGVLKLFDVLPQDRENNFLGITKENVSYYKDLPLESKFALSWKSHVERLNYLEQKFPENVIVLNYEDFYGELNELFVKMNNFLNTDFNFYSESLNSDGIEKWKTTLTKNNIDNINNVLKK